MNRCDAAAPTDLGPAGAALAGRTVADVMVRAPKTLDASATVQHVRSLLTDDHVHMALLIDGQLLVGTLTRDDLPVSEPSSGGPDAPDPDARSPALSWARLAGRTVSPSASATATFRAMVLERHRRLAVVADDGTLLGLLCLKASRTGFCGDLDVLSRAAAAPGRDPVADRGVVER